MTDEWSLPLTSRLTWLCQPSQSGLMHLSSPEREDVWFRQLYEKAVAGFYDVVLADSGWHVDSGRRISWPIEPQNPPESTPVAK